jgi:hypothetical protein
MGDFFASAKSITEYCSIIIICLMFDSFVYTIRVGLWLCVRVCVHARTHVCAPCY